MKDKERIELEKLVLAPYLQKATALIGRSRQVGGNQFRHAMATFAILIDYHCTDPVLLKASVVHDLLEDVPETKASDIKAIDDDGEEVLQLVLEVTRRREPKRDYLQRLKDHGSQRAKLLKVADRISNLTDLHQSVSGADFVRRYTEETLEFVYPMALDINQEMAREIHDLIKQRQKSLDGE